MDYTFNNTLIKAYFEGDDSYIPTGELVYLHEHPMVKPNFLTELEQLVLDAGKIIMKYNIKGHVLDKFIDAGIRIGTGMPQGTISSEQAIQILGGMRDAYKLSTDLITKLD